MPDILSARAPTPAEPLMAVRALLTAHQRARLEAELRADLDRDTKLLRRLERAGVCTLAVQRRIDVAVDSLFDLSWGAE